MAYGYSRPIPVVRDLLYGALYETLRANDRILQPREDGVDVLDTAYENADAAVRVGILMDGLPKGKSSAYIHYWASKMAGVSEVGRELLEPSLITLGLATKNNLPEVLAFIDSNFRDADGKFDRLAGTGIGALLLRLGLARRILLVLYAIDADRPWWSGPITRRQVNRLTNVNLDWILNFSPGGAQEMLMVAVHMAYDSKFYSTVTEVLGGAAVERLRARITPDEYGAIVHPLDKLDQRRIAKAQSLRAPNSPASLTRP
jgi:hypothetical protein